MNIFKDDHWGRLRSDRNILLKETDWWASSDLVMTQEQKEKFEARKKRN